MTTIIVVVVVALVFFVSVCVAAFMVWKRESEMRTDSILAIEHNLEKLGATLTDDIGQEALQEETEDFRQERQKERERQRILKPTAGLRMSAALFLFQADTARRSRW